MQDINLIKRRIFRLRGECRRYASAIAKSPREAGLSYEQYGEISKTYTRKLAQLSALEDIVAESEGR